MIIKPAQKLNGIGEYYFSKKLREIEELRAQGKTIINLGIGSPDIPPPTDVIEALVQTAFMPNAHGYQGYKGIPALRAAFANWYQKWYSVSLDPNTEILPLMGSKEGIMHICMSFLDEGDEVLLPDPGYPTYSSAAKLAGASLRNYDLLAQNNYAPDFDALEQTDLSKVKIMFVNYPQMPTGQNANIDVFKKLVAFGLKHNILIVHDNPYSYILNDKPLSIMSIDGAKESCVELNSLSKSHGMAGWRVGVLVGNEDIINTVLTFKSNMDSGMFLGLQMAAVKALSLDVAWFRELNEIYTIRRAIVFQILNKLNASFDANQTGMFVWAKIAPDFKDGFEMSDYYLYNYNVFITPGGIFGKNGLEYIRVSLCAPEETFNQVLNIIAKADK